MLSSLTTKSEYLNPKQFLNSNSLNSKQSKFTRLLGFRIWDLLRISDFGFRIFKFCLNILIFTFYILHFNGYAQSPQYVRVAVVQDASSLRLKIKGAYEIVDAATDKVLRRNKNLNATVTVYKQDILLGDISLKSDKLFIRPQKPDAITIDGRRFRGNLLLLKKNNARLSAINQIELEDYIKGILYHEASHYWPLEALRAQAIACRTYAIYQAQESKLRDYDVTADVYSQVYGGRASERYRTNKAVEETRGLLLTYQGKVFPAYYHATCAGHTEDAALLWNIDIAPLKGVVCNFCQDSPHFRWHYVLSLEEIEKKLRESGYNINNIKDIIALDKNKSGRITDLKIVTNNKKEIRIFAKDFRNIFGSNQIRSTNFTVKVANGDAIFVGFGWGHGVGLCQWGAYFMAKQGYTYQEILKYYYPQSNVETIRF